MTALAPARADPPAPDGREPALDVRLLPAALAGWAVTAAGIRWSCGPVLAIGAAALVPGCLLLRRRATRRTDRRRSTGCRTIAGAVAAAAAVAAGFAVAVTLRTDAIAEHPLTRRIGQTVAVTVVPSESPRAVGGARLLIPATVREVGGAAAGGRVTVFAPAAFAEYGVGQPLAFRARVSRPMRADLTVAVLTVAGTPTAGRAPPAQRFAQRVRDRFALACRRALPGDQATVLPALVLGDTSAVSGVRVAEFRAAGLLHLMAVSGANVTIVCGAVLLTAGLAGPRTAVLAAVPALAGFVLIVQPSASVLRAAVMGSIGLLAVLTARRRQALPALAAAVLVLLAVAPHLAVDIGFALSTVATAALVLIAPAWSRRLTARGWPKPLADALAVCAAAQLCTAPLVAAAMGTLSLVAVAANIAVTAAVAPITVLGTAAAALTGLWPPAADLLIRLTGPLLWALLWVARHAAAVPGAVVAVPAGPAGFALVALATVAGVLAWRRLGLGRAVGATVVVLAAATVAGWV